jgi:succinoglycan biosynthesis transport protein ExoP
LDPLTNARVLAEPYGRRDLALYGDELDWREESENRLGAQLLGLLRIAVKWKWLILGALLVGMAIGLLVTLLTTPVYRGETTLQIERDAPKIVNVEGLEPNAAMQDAEFFQTQYGLLKSRSLAERVVKSLNLEADPAFTRKGWRPTQEGSTTPVPPEVDRDARIERAADHLMKGLHVDPVRASKLVTVGFDDTDPVRAARVANQVSTDFIQSNLERRYEASAYARGFLESRLAQVRQKLEDSERELAAYATSQQIINVGTVGATKTDPNGNGAQSLTAADLDSMNRALADAQQARILAEQKWRQAEATQGLGLPELQASKTMDTLREQKAALTADYQEKLKTYKPEYSAMVQLKAKIDEVDREIAENTGSVKESLHAQYIVALNNENALAAKVRGLKTSFLDLQNRSIRYNIIQRDVDTSRSFYEGLLEREKEVAVAGVGSNNVSIVDAARIPRMPIKPRPVLNLALAGGLGLLFGLALAFGLDQLDHSIKQPNDVETKLRLPLLGAIPLVKGKVEPLTAITDPRSAIAEAYISARTALLLSTPESLPSPLLITSAQPSEGKSTTAAALASSLAAIGRMVLLIDADLRNPSLHNVFAVQNVSGFSNLLAGLSSLDAEVRPTGLGNLKLLPGGPTPPNPAELLTGDRLRAILSEAATRFDVVILDGPPIMGLADAPLLATAASGTILVIEAGETGHQMALTALKRIESGGARVLGVVLTKFNHAAGLGGDYGYAYNYSGKDQRSPRIRLIGRNVGKLFRRI